MNTRICRLAFTAGLALAAGSVVAQEKAVSAAPPAGPPAAAATVVATVGGRTIAASAVDDLIRAQLMDLRAREEQLRKQALDVLIAQALIEEEAAARGSTTDALEKSEVEAKAGVSEAEAKAFYEQNKSRFGQTPEAEALKQIETGLGQQRQNERRLAFAEELRKKHPVNVLLEPWRVPVAIGDAPVRGNQNAAVTIVEFSDFQCPFCVRARPSVARVREAYGEKVRWVFRHFPLDFHPLAQKAGEAAACAADQGKFWEMHDRLWQSAGKLQLADLKGYAAALGFDVASFDTCLDSGRHADRLERDQEAGRQYGVSGTPAFFINGRPLVGAQPFEAFQQVIDDELRRTAVAAAPPAAASR